jgi:hypothetical protein
MQELEQRAVGLAEVTTRARPRAQRITARRLDFDDVGTGVGEQLGAVRRRDSGREIDDPKVTELAGSQARIPCCFRNDSRAAQNATVIAAMATPTVEMNPDSRSTPPMPDSVRMTMALMPP